MVRIRIGESWKQNPTYVDALRALAEGRARGFSPRDIVDVLGIEVDGVDLAQGSGEAVLVDAVAQLVRAARSLAAGPGRARVRLEKAPVELRLERRGDELLLALHPSGDAPRPEPLPLARPVSVDPLRFLAAARRAARMLIADLLAIHPGLADTRLVRGLVREAARTGRSREDEAARSLQLAAGDVPARMPVLSAAMGRLALVLRGTPARVCALGPNGQVCWADRRPAALALTELSRTLSRVGTGTLRALPAGLAMDRTRSALLFGSEPVPLEDAARAVGELWRRYSGEEAFPVEAEPEAEAPAPVDEPCTDGAAALEPIPLPGVGERAAAALSAAERVSEPAVRAPGLPPAGLRRLFLRPAWRADLPGRRCTLARCGRELLVAGGGRVELRSLAGALLWSIPLLDGHAVASAAGPRVVGRDNHGSVVVLDGRTGARLERIPSRLRRVEEALALRDGSLVARDGSRFMVWQPGIAPWTFEGPTERSIFLAPAGGGLLASTDHGEVRALRSDGTPLWIARAPLASVTALTLDPRREAVLVVGNDATGDAVAVSLRLSDGGLRWRTPLEAARPSPPLVLARRAVFGAATAAGVTLLALDADSGTPEWRLVLPGDGAAVPVAGPRSIVVSRAAGGVCTVSYRGELLAERAPADPEPSLSPVHPRPALVGAGLVVVSAALVHVFEAGSLRLLSSLEPVLLAPESVVLLDGPVLVAASRGGSFAEGWRAAGHLGVVPGRGADDRG